MFHVTVLLFFITAIPRTRALDLCNQQSILSTNLTPYDYKTEPEQNCNCTLNKTSCVRKCCAIGFYAIEGACVPYENLDFVFNIPVHTGREFVRNVSGNTGVLVGTMNCTFFSLPNISKDWFSVQEDGTILTSTYDTLTNDYYCVDYMEGQLKAFVCFKDNSLEEIIRELLSAGMTISMLFLLATFVAYAFLPDKNLHMKALMFYVIMLMLSYLLLIIIQHQRPISDEVCKGMGYCCIFFFLVSFFWMNVICIDIWFAFSGLRSFSANKKVAERKRFLVYCMYAWGTPVVIVLTVFFIDVKVPADSSLKPAVGDDRCFLKRGLPELVYFFGPIGVLIAANIILFMITAFKIRSIKKDTSVLNKEDSRRHAFENDKQTFNLYLKLLFAMGINWSMEIISWAVLWANNKAPDWIFYLTDFCNAIYGVFIFFIFVFKRNIWKQLQKQYHSLSSKPYLSHRRTKTNGTKVTSCFTISSSFPENQRGGTNGTRFTRSTNNSNNT